MIPFHQRAQHDQDARRLLRETPASSPGCVYAVHYRMRHSDTVRVQTFTSAVARAAWVVACGGYVEILDQTESAAS